MEKTTTKQKRKNADDCPLVGCSFFLDQIPLDEKTRKLCGILISLGANIEGSLSGTVTHVLTNRTEAQLAQIKGNVALRSSGPISAEQELKFISPAVSSPRKKRLDKLLTASQNGPITYQMEDVLVIAKRMGKRVCHVDAIIPWLNRHQQRKFPRLAVEDTTGAYKPLEKVFVPEKPPVPSLHLDTAVDFPGLSPFYTREESAILSKKKEEKEGVSKVHKRDTRSGWCECCNANYKSFEQHVNCAKHRSFASNKKNYEQIDSFIAMLGQ